MAAAAVLLLLWFNSSQVCYQAQTASAAQAAETCPFSLITRQEFQLAAGLSADESVTAFYPNPGGVDPPMSCLWAWWMPQPAVLPPWELTLTGAFYCAF